MEKMSCRECEKMIPDFIDRKMDYVTLKRFCEHVNECDDCKEELTIQYLVSEGVSRLLEGNTFDLNREMDKRMNEARRRIRRGDGFVSAGFVAEIVSMTAIVGFVIWVVVR